MANNDRIFDAIKKDLDKFKKTIQDNVMGDAAEEAARLIKVRTRLGYGADGEQREKLRPLSDLYVRERKGEIIFHHGKNGAAWFEEVNREAKVFTNKKIGAHSKLDKNFKVIREKFKVTINSSVTSPKKSNLTRYGDMLNSIRAKYLGNGRAEVTITGSDSDGVSNADKARWNEEKGRKFFSITKNERLQLARFIRERIDILIKSTNF